MGGLGVYTWPDGKRYEGFYQEDKKTGLGKFSWPTGMSYNGFWKEGKQHGIGIHIRSGG